MSTLSLGVAVALAGARAGCAANTVIPDSSLATVVGTVFTGTVDIQGRFFADADVLFQNAQVYLEPGAEIIVQGGHFLDIETSSFTACK